MLKDFKTAKALTIHIYIPLLVHGLPKVEQPASSLLRHCPYYEHLLLNCGPSFLKQTWMGLYGHFSCKPTMLFGNAPGTYWSWAHDILTTTSATSIFPISPYTREGAQSLVEAHGRRFRRTHAKGQKGWPPFVFKGDGEKNHIQNQPKQDLGEPWRVVMGNGWWVISEGWWVSYEWWRIVRCIFPQSGVAASFVNTPSKIFPLLQ